MPDNWPDLPVPDVLTRFVAGDELTDEEHLRLQTYLLFRVVQEAEHVCSNTQMQMSAIGDLFEKLDPTVEVEVPE